MRPPRHIPHGGDGYETNRLTTQREDLHNVMDLLTLSEKHARTLLIHHPWKVLLIYNGPWPLHLQQLFFSEYYLFSDHLMAPAAATDNIKPRDVCIVGVARTPMGGFLGTLSSLPATKLGALKRAHGHANLVQEVFFGNVLSANLGQAPARQAALGAGIPNSVVCTTINKVCSSGMKAQSIQLGINDVVVAGGMESMCNAPKYLAETRKGSRLGHDMVIDGMLKDGLWDVYNDYAMGMCAELCADQHTITRGAAPDSDFNVYISANPWKSWHFSIDSLSYEASRSQPLALVDIPEVEEIPDEFPFQIQDNPGEQTISLIRQYNGETIKVEVHMPDLVTAMTTILSVREREASEDQISHEGPDFSLLYPKFFILELLQGLQFLMYQTLLDLSTRVDNVVARVTCETLEPCLIRLQDLRPLSIVMKRSHYEILVLSRDHQINCHSAS
ncbi:hypothetical protein MRB53_023239 [Persea americana]|uniref:Uncharacterized protein n=1 Tax=Persea americana TaxID=3435 RepID=A0ACC2L9N1_PERAE|nr:hypothetical protein MRB53_023239 [Persea americana]